ncbi:hypothetical protein BSKO_00218 [Bryopsis sp. KO-2023]|nr:hypothetical protein BSKO_00218 [Bryopsis sp. KO-2023]
MSVAGEFGSRCPSNYCRRFEWRGCWRTRSPRDRIAGVMDNKGSALLNRRKVVPSTVGLATEQNGAEKAEAMVGGTAEGDAAILKDESDDLEELKRQVAQLQNLVLDQQDICEDQKNKIEGLRRLVTGETPAGISPFEAQTCGIGDRRLLGMFDARFHSLHAGATPPDYRVLPERIILVRHAESEGNVNKHIYSVVPDRKLPLTERGWQQAESAGKRLQTIMERGGKDYKMYFFISPYRRSYQTYEGIRKAFREEDVVGACEEVQLREQDFGNFQDPGGKKKELAERLEFGRFFYRFPNGESGADVYDRITIFEDHLVRDINAGRFAQGNVNLVLVTHGLALRIILMRWFHWTVDQFLNVYNPPNAEPVILERVPPTGNGQSWMHTKMLYRMSSDSLRTLKGCAEDMVIPSCKT